jgi:Na+-transporting methylmalonyl-CoA/oxaloacetate decarboxylase gamma subunit
MEELTELMRQPEGMAVVLAFLALLVTVMATLYGALERAALARRLAALEAEIEDDSETSLLLSSPADGSGARIPAGLPEEADKDDLPPGIRFV